MMASAHRIVSTRQGGTAWRLTILAAGQAYGSRRCGGS